MAEYDPEFRIELAISEEEIRNQFQKELESMGICPVVITIDDAPHAGFLEFGTSGSPEGKTPYKKILDWAEAKPQFAGLPPSEKKHVAYAIKKKIDAKGTKPHPFVRPSLEWARDSGIVTRLMMGATTMDVADSIIQEMRFHLEINDSIYKWQVYDGLHARKGGSWGTQREDFDVDEAMRQFKEEMKRG